MKKILITGGAGFIGSHLAKKLIDSGYEVVIIDRLTDHNIELKKGRLNKFLDPKKYAFYDIELSDFLGLKKIFKKHNFDAICHLAVKTDLEFNSELYKKTNIHGTISIFELAKDFSVPKVVFASSSMVYGGNTKMPFSEQDDTDHPLSLYAATKKYDEVLAHTYHHLYKIKMVGLRFFTTYGPWGRPDMSISKVTEQILNDKKIIIQNFGKTKRDFSYVEDVVEGIKAAIEKDLDFELINLGSGESTELNKIISLIEKNIGKEAKKEYVEMQPGDLPKTWADTKKAKELLDYNPKTTIDEGIKKFVNWYKEYNK